MLTQPKRLKLSVWFCVYETQNLDCMSFLIVDIIVYVILKLINVLFVPGISVLLDDAKVKSNNYKFVRR